ncbi:MAG: hypothetical protein ACI4FN_04450 [Acutalibacteraceae bacterium]
MKIVLAIVFILTFAAYLFFLIYNLYKKRAERNNQNKSKMNDVILQLEKQRKRGIAVKFLIYSLTFVIGTALNTLLGIFTGIKFGAFFLYIIEFAIAQKLYGKFDNHRKQKSSINPRIKH